MDTIRRLSISRLKVKELTLLDMKNKLWKIKYTLKWFYGTDKALEEVDRILNMKIDSDKLDCRPSVYRNIITYPTGKRESLLDILKP